MAERKAVTKEMARRYEKASKAVKGSTLDELCALTSWSRRHARRALLAAGSLEQPSQRRPRCAPRTYDDATIAALLKLWKLMGGPCGKRMAPFLAEFLVALERHGECDHDPDVRAKLCAISAATIDRATAPERKRLQIKGRHGTKPGTLLKNQIPIRTFAQWDDAAPGFCEVDLVSHDGGDASGEFAQTLNLTDVCSGWTVMAAVQNKAQKWVFEALKAIADELPVPLRGLDSDNGSEFINAHLFAWCGQRRITFTRSRAYRKNDNCFVEQKNWTHVRQQVGYARYDTPAAVAALNELYVVLRLWVNFFCPQRGWSQRRATAHAFTAATTSRPLRINGCWHHHRYPKRPRQPCEASIWR